MASLHTVFRTTLEADATLTALLTGGIFDAEELDYSGEGAGQAPRQADAVQLKPHAVIRWSGGSPTGASYKVAGEVESVEVYVYQDVGYDVIESAILRMRTVLGDRYLSADDRALAHVSKQPFRGPQTTADELGMASCQFVRFFVTTAPL